MIHRLKQGKHLTGIWTERFKLQNTEKKFENHLTLFVYRHKLPLLNFFVTLISRKETLYLGLLSFLGEAMEKILEVAMFKGKN